MREQSPAPPRLLSAFVKILAGLIAAVILLALLFPVYATDGHGAVPTEGSNLRQIGLGLIIYSNDYNEKLPPAMSTSTELRLYCLPYTKNASIFDCANPAGGQILGNGVLAGRSVDKLIDPNTTVMVYDSRPFKKASAVVCYADGHTKWNIPFETMLRQLTVDPFDPSQHPGHKRPAHV